MAGCVFISVNSKFEGFLTIIGVFIFCCYSLFTMFMCSFQPQPFKSPCLLFAKLNYVPTLISSHSLGIYTRSSNEIIYLPSWPKLLRPLLQTIPSRSRKMIWLQPHPIFITLSLIIESWSKVFISCKSDKHW